MELDGKLSDESSSSGGSQVAYFQASPSAKSSDIQCLVSIDACEGSLSTINILRYIMYDHMKLTICMGDRFFCINIIWTSFVNRVPLVIFDGKQRVGYPKVPGSHGMPWVQTSLFFRGQSSARTPKEVINSSCPKPCARAAVMCCLRRVGMISNMKKGPLGEV